MTKDPDPDRLRALEARLARARGAPAPGPGQAGRALSQGEVAWRMVIELVTGMLLGFGIGYGLDALFGTRPWLMVVFALLGFAAGVRTMIGTARQLAAKTSAGEPAARARPGADDDRRRNGHGG